MRLNKDQVIRFRKIGTFGQNIHVKDGCSTLVLKVDWTGLDWISRWDEVKSTLQC